jgi:hypothetical protein
MRTIVALSLAVLLGASASESAPITVSAGDFVTFNLDLSGATPAPPYDRALLSLARTGLDIPGDVGEWLFWTELNGTGSVFALGDATLGALANFVELNDGVVSATLRMTSGAITVEPCLLGIPAEGRRASTGGECDRFLEPPPPPAPEPVTVTLLGVGIALALVRRGGRTRSS